MQKIIQIIIIAYFQSSLYLLRKNFFNTFSIGYNAILSNKVKNIKYHTFGTIPKSNIKIVERGKIDTPNTQIHDCSLSWLGTGTSIKCGRVKLVLSAQISPLRFLVK
jgi:hypothetical protein